MAEGDQGQGRGAHPVCAHHRHGADRARLARHRPARDLRGVAQAPLHGVSFAHTLDDPDAETHHHTQYFEMLGHRAIDHDGWRAVCPWPGPSFAEAGKGFGEPISSETLSKLDSEGWELYHVAEDPAETQNVAAENRSRLIAMIATWYVEAGKYQVMPIDGSGLAQDGRRKAADRATPRPLHLPPQHPVDPQLRSTKGTQPPPQHHRLRRDPHRRRRGRAAQPGHRSRRILASTSRTASCATSTTTSADGYSRVESEHAVPAGKHDLRFEFEPTGKPDMPNGKGAPGRLQLYIDGAMVGNADAEFTTPFMFNPGSLTCGANPGSPVTPDYEGPFTFTGTLHNVTLDVSGELIHDPEAELRMHLARQ